MLEAKKKTLFISNLLNEIHKIFDQVPDPRTLNNRANITLAEHLMSGLAIFGLKFPSLLSYDKRRKSPEIEKNLASLYHVKNAPSDSYLRERLDEVDPIYLRKAFKKLFSLIQRAKVLEEYEFMDDHYLLSVDATGQFSSGNIQCKHCCVKKHRNGSCTYYHQMLGACIVHPSQSSVIPFCPEIIQNADGSEKNDCELNASKRFYENFRKEHPHLKVIVLGDSIASNAPNIQNLENKGMKYILGAKPGNHEYLFGKIDQSSEAKYHEIIDEKGYLHQFRYLNDVSLNASNKDVKVNFLEYRQTDPKGKESDFSWVTNIEISEENVEKIMRGGRTRWKIENETFNTLKNLGYNLEHNYGHGKQYLSTIFCALMMLSFFIDEIQKISCDLFKAVKRAMGSNRDMWAEIKVLFQRIHFENWESFYSLIARVPIPDTS